MKTNKGESVCVPGGDLLMLTYPSIHVIENKYTVKKNQTQKNNK